MRILVLVLFAAVIGVGLGVTSTWSHFAGVREDFDNPSAAAPIPLVKSSASDTPATKPSGARVEVVNGATHDFGEMERNGKRSHRFVLKNIGIATLHLENGGTSCSACTINSLTHSDLAPGESAEVLVEWTAVTPDSEFRKEAYVRTNDSQQATVRLVVQGKVKQSILVEPSEIAVGRVTQSGEAHATAQIFSFRRETLSLATHEFLKPDLADFFEVDLAPLEPAEVEKRPGATAGWKMKLRVKPGLPLGGLSQTIRLATSLADVPTIEVPIHAVVVGDISIVGNRFREEQNMVSLGVVERTKGGSCVLHVVVKGAFRNDVQITVASVEPAHVLQATIGPSKSLTDGAVLTFPLKIEIPANAPADSRLGGLDPKEYGQIILRTTHPTAKEIKLLVRFAVEG